jgi:hypothetical protein
MEVLAIMLLLCVYLTVSFHYIDTYLQPTHYIRSKLNYKSAKPQLQMRSHEIPYSLTSKPSSSLFARSVADNPSFKSRRSSIVILVKSFYLFLKGLLLSLYQIIFRAKDKSINNNIPQSKAVSHAKDMPISTSDPLSNQPYIEVNDDKDKKYVLHKLNELDQLLSYAQRYKERYALDGEQRSKYAPWMNDLQQAKTSLSGSSNATAVSSSSYVEPMSLTSSSTNPMPSMSNNKLVASIVEKTDILARVANNTDVLVSESGSWEASAVKTSDRQITASDDWIDKSSISLPSSSPIATTEVSSMTAAMHSGSELLAATTATTADLSNPTRNVAIPTTLTAPSTTMPINQPSLSLAADTTTVNPVSSLIASELLEEESEEMKVATAILTRSLLGEWVLDATLSDSHHSLTARLQLSASSDVQIKDEDRSIHGLHWHLIPRSIDSPTSVANHMVEIVVREKYSDNDHHHHHETKLYLIQGSIVGNRILGSVFEDIHTSSTKPLSSQDINIDRRSWLKQYRSSWKVSGNFQLRR